MDIAAAPMPADKPAPTKRRVLVFGDSITYGAWDSQGGWCDRLKQFYHTQAFQMNGHILTQVYNLGIGGETSKGLVARFENDLEVRYSASWQPYILIAAGINDTRGINGETNIQVPIEDFKTNLNNLIETAKRHTPKVLLVGLTPIRDDVIQFKEFTYVTTRIQQYDAAITELAAQHAIEKVALFDAMLPWRADIYAPDGLHPNDKGHKLMFDHIQPAVERLLTEGA